MRLLQAITLLITLTKIETNAKFLAKISANSFTINADFFASIDANSYHKIIYHVDNATRYSVIKLDRIVEVLIYNYDDPNCKPTRVTGSSYLNVVYLQMPERFAKFVVLNSNLNFLDIIVFVVENDAFNDILSIENLQNSGGVFFYNSANGTFYSANYFTKNPKAIKQLHDKVYRKDFANFDGHKFRIGFTHYHPVLYSIKDASGNVKLAGIEYNILSEMSKRLNFVYEGVEFKNCPGGNWPALVIAVGEKKLDFAMGGITATLERHKIVDFTWPIRNDAFEALYAIRHNSRRGGTYLQRPFGLIAWCCILLCLLLIYAIIKTFHFVRRLAEMISPFIIVISIVVEQPLANLNKRRFYIRFLFALLYLLFFNITYLYKSKLTSDALTKTIEPSLTFQDLSEDKFRLEASGNGTQVLYDYLQESNNSLHKKLLNKLKYVYRRNFCENIKNLLNNPIGFVGLNFYLRTRTIANCDDYFERDKLAYLRITNDHLFPLYQGWPLKMNVPYEKSFSKFIKALYSNGLLKHWVDTLSKYVNIRSRGFLEDKFIRIYVFQDSFLILATGLCLAVLIFLLELKRFI